MLDTLTLVEARDLPLLPEPKAITKEKMLAVAQIIDVPVDVTPHRTGILPQGCWWMPQAQLVLYGSACQRPILLEEISLVCRATGLSGIVLRECAVSASRTRYTFDTYHAGSWYLRSLLWISEAGTAWLIPDWGDDQFFRLSQWGLDAADQPPFLGMEERLSGVARGADYLAAFVRRR
ncbi:MAG: hypothetical protein ACK4SZ_06745 [Allosphingosinicella sp.]|uniref:hypothetical protein n=1 Tax=Allosphingosinicella sp. TaxID=2823234 RepID=UPI003941735D